MSQQTPSTTGKKKRHQTPSSGKKRKIEATSIPVISSADGVQFLFKRLMSNLKVHEEDEEENLNQSFSNNNNGHSSKRKHSRKSIKWTDSRKRLAIGINECSRILEQAERENPELNESHLIEAGIEEGKIDQMNEKSQTPPLLLLICRGVRPSYMVNFLIDLARSKGCKCRMVPMSSSAFGCLMDMKKCVALAILDQHPSSVGASSSDPFKRFTQDLMALPHSSL